MTKQQATASVPPIPEPDSDEAARAAALAEHERTQRDLKELAACTSDMVQAVSRHIDHLLQHNAEVGKPLSIQEANDRARSISPLNGDNPPAFDAQHISWHELASRAEHRDERLLELWQQVKASARKEWETGARTAKSLELPVHHTPMERARFFVLLDAFRDALKPRDALEDVLIQQMAGAFDMHLRWQQKSIYRLEEDERQIERDLRRMLEQMSKRERAWHEQAGGWLPPRQSTADAIEQAAIIADRYQRSFLRLLKAFRDNRRMFASLIVAADTVNIAEGGPQQINLAGGDD